MPWEVEFHPDAAAEFAALLSRDLREYVALQTAIEKLQLFGDKLPPPHSSNVRGMTKVWELRPRRGRSPWRAFYRRIGPTMVIGAIGPEAEADPQGFRHAVASAEARLDTIERERG